MLTLPRPSWGTGAAQRASYAAKPTLWASLALLYVPALGHQGGLLYDHAGLGLHASVGGATYVPATQGLGLLCDVGTEGVSLTAPASLKPTDHTSLIWYGRWTGTVSANTPIFGVSHSNADASPYVSYLLDVDGAGTRMRAVASHGGVFGGAVQLGTLSTQVDYVAIGTFRSGMTQFYLNGFLQAQDTTLTGSLTYSATSQVLLQRHQSATTRVFNGVCYLAAIYTRVLTPAEVWQISHDPFLLVRPRPRTSLAVVDTSIPQLSRPMADITEDNWTDQAGGTTDLYQTLDETVAEDADYIMTQLSPTSDVYVAQLSPVFDPLRSTGYLVRYRYGKSAAAGQQVNLTVQLRQEYVSEGSPGTLIAEAVHTDIGVFPVVGTLSLSGAEADAITDHSSLFIRFLANAP